MATPRETPRPTPRDTPRDPIAIDFTAEDPTRSSSVGGVVKTLRNRMQSVSANLQRAIMLCPSLDGSNETREDFEISYEDIYQLRQALRTSLREALAACNSCALLDPVLAAISSSAISGSSAIPYNSIGIGQLAFAAPPVFVGGSDTATRERTHVGLWRRCVDDLGRAYWFHEVSRRTVWSLPSSADSVDDDAEGTAINQQSSGAIIYRPVIDARGSIFFVDHSTQAATNSVPCSEHCWIETHEARNVLYRNAKTLEVSDVRPKTAPSLRPPPPAPPVDVAHMAQPMPAPPSRKSIHLKSSSPMVSFRDNYDEPDAPPPPIDDSDL